MRFASSRAARVRKTRLWKPVWCIACVIDFPTATYCGGAADTFRSCFPNHAPLGLQRSYTYTYLLSIPNRSVHEPSLASSANFGESEDSQARSRSPLRVPPEGGGMDESEWREDGGWPAGSAGGSAKSYTKFIISRRYNVCRCSAEV